jgi:predicted transcriptional regulator
METRMNILNNIPIAEGKTDTSRLAAVAIGTVAVGLREKIIAHLGKRDALTADELSEQLDLPITSIRPRVSEMRKVGLLADTGARRTHRSGVKASIIWRLTPEGKVLLAPPAAD